MPATDGDIKASTVTYKKSMLSMYDLVVLDISNNYIWKCPSNLILEFYNKHITDNHLDIGVGTGYFLDKCTFPTSQPKITMLDISQDSLDTTAKRIARYSPTKYVANLLGNEEWTIGSFNSIGINYVLHCLPTTIEEKEAVIHKLKEHLNEEGIIFGTTILGKDIEKSYLARQLMDFYNSKKLFTNTEDSPEAIERIFSRAFPKYQVQQHGCVMFFAAWK